MNKKRAYWICQLGGWLFFVFLNSVFLQLNNAFDIQMGLSMLLFFFMGVGFTHLYRFIILKLAWLRLKVIAQIPRVIITSLTLAILMDLTQYSLETLMGIAGKKHQYTVDIITNIINLSFVFSFWALIYFLFHYIENYKKSEIENLKWQASINEIELNKLKSQLNPHFMFNAMNSIRALVDDEPNKSKMAITQLSNILRNTLQMGKNKVIPFEEEIKMVNDYLSLEKIRYEERLHTLIEIQKECYTYFIPPLMIQTLVENAIKHGISKLTTGGTINIKAFVQNKNLVVQITNNGVLETTNTSETGYGIVNTKQRLHLLFGHEASFVLHSISANLVMAQINIPKNLNEYQKPETL
jgi:two-component system, LytTR family, sensor kinase